MLKSNIDVFFVTSFLCSLEFLLFHRIEYPKRCLWKKNWNFSKTQFLWYDCTFKKQCTVSVTLTIDLWRSMFFQWIEYHPINILHKFHIDISSNSREIKYQNIGRTHRQIHRHTDTQTDRQTGWKQYLATPSGGEVIKRGKKSLWQTHNGISSTKCLNYCQDHQMFIPVNNIWLQQRFHNVGGKLWKRWKK